MTKDEIIEMAKKAGMVKITKPTGIEIDEWWGVELSDIEHFSELVAEKEREECAKMCDLAMLQNQKAINELENDEHIAKCFIQGAMTQLVKTAKAIRSRGQS